MENNNTVEKQIVDILVEADNNLETITDNVELSIDLDMENENEYIEELLSDDETINQNDLLLSKIFKRNAKTAA